MFAFGNWVDQVSQYLLIAQYLAMFVLTPKPYEKLPYIISTIVFGINKKRFKMCVYK